MSSGQSITAAHVFAQVALDRADDIALRHREHTLTYAELAQTAGAVAEWLRGQGVGRGDVVAVVMDRSHRCMIGVMAAWAVGAAYLHIETTDPDPRISALLALTKTRAVIADQPNQARLPTGGPPSLVLDNVTEGSHYTIAPGLAATDVAYLVCTSGSTGIPKAVQVPHSALLNYCAGFWRRVMPGSLRSFGLTTTFAADLGKVSVYGALLSGARLDVYSRETVLDPQALAADLAAHPTDCLTYTPTQLEALAGADPGLAAVLPRRALVVAGEAFPPRLARAILQERPRLEIYNGYGPSEATILATMHRVSAADGERVRVPIGTPLDGVKAVVLDADARPVSEGTPGILYLGGACLALGYLGDEARTESAFVSIGDDRYYRTDDLTIAGQGGTLDYLGRTDRQLKIRGNRVEPGEVENAILALPRVRQVVVTGEGEPLELVAYEVGEPNVQELIRRLRASLPSALVPSYVHAVRSIPVTHNGKIDVRALRAEIVPSLNRPEPPATQTERLISETWGSVLGRTDIGRNERFLEIGGDSFKALTVFARLRRHYPRLSITDLYAHGTIAELAAAIEGVPSAGRGHEAQVVEL
jgi:amino acid adenylation domain-containing protein